MTIIKILDEALPLKIEWLRTFIAVADAAGYSKAARLLHRSQPAVSTHVKELEANLGSVLLETRGARTWMTPAGEIVRREAQQILEQAAGLVSAVQAAEQEPAGLVRIAASTTPANYLLPAAMVAFERRYPRARTALVAAASGRVLELVGANQADVGVVGLEPEDGQFVVEPFEHAELVLFGSAGDPLARARRVSVEALRGRRFLMREPGSATRRLGEAWLASNGLHPAVMELGSPETVKRAAAAGLGLGILSRFAVAWEVRQGRLAILRAPGLPVRRRLYAVRHRRKHVTRAIGSFLEALRELARRQRR